MRSVLANGFLKKAATSWKTDCMEEMFACVATPVSAQLYRNRLGPYLQCVNLSMASLVSLCYSFGNVSIGLVGANMHQIIRTDSSCMVLLPNI